jgi:hypothetical protein
MSCRSSIAPESCGEEAPSNDAVASLRMVSAATVVDLSFAVGQ